jgi:hypothetical protein
MGGRRSWSLAGSITTTLLCFCTCVYFTIFEFHYEYKRSLIDHQSDHPPAAPHVRMTPVSTITWAQHWVGWHPLRLATRGLVACMPRSRYLIYNTMFPACLPD